MIRRNLQIIRIGGTLPEVSAGALAAPPEVDFFVAVTFAANPGLLDIKELNEPHAEPRSCLVGGVVVIAPMQC